MKKEALIIFIALMIISVTTSFIVTADADDTHVYIIPDGLHIEIGDTSNVLIWANTTQAINGWQFQYLNFTQGIINVSHLQDGYFFASNGTGAGYTHGIGTIHNDTGIVGGSWVDYCYEVGPGGCFQNNTNNTVLNITIQGYRCGEANITFISVGDAEFGMGGGEILYTLHNKNLTVHPQYPQTFTATSYGQSQINLSWTKGNGTDRTVIERNTLLNWEKGEGTVVYNDTNTGCQDTGLNSTILYYYQSWGFNSTKKLFSLSYNRANATTQSEGNKSPTFGIPSPTNGSTGQDLSFTWVILINDSNGDLFNWTIECSNSQTNGTNEDNNGTKDLTLTGLAYSTMYRVHVNATDTNGSGFWTCEWFTFKTRNSPSSPPSNGNNDGDHDSDKSENKGENETKEFIENLYNITLEQNFYANDTDGDGTVDTFTDPNGILNDERFVNISDNASFLISVNGNLDELFIWDTEADAITSVKYNVGMIAGTMIDTSNNSIIINVNIDKINWTYIEVTDKYPNIYNLTVKTSDGRIVSSDMIWKENGKIYVLDDPDTEYQFIYHFTILSPAFNPTNGTTFNIFKPTVNITYSETVTVIQVTLNDESINLTTTDNLTFTYMPKTNLTNEIYTLSITVQDIDNNSRTDIAVYTINIEKIEEPLKDDETSGFEFIFAIVAIAFILFWKRRG